MSKSGRQLLRQLEQVPVKYHSTDDERPLHDVVPRETIDAIFKVVTAHIQAVGEVTGETSDGHHTFNELYEYRMLYNAALFNEWAQQNWAGSKTAPEVWKSDRHNDGELCFGGGWFVVGACLESGQITNHYEMKHWDLFDAPKLKQAPKWDGHTPQEAAKRLAQYLGKQKDETLPH